MANPRTRPDPDMECERLLEELAEQRAIVAGIFESVPGAFIILDHRWRLVNLNDKARELFGGSSIALIGRTLEEVHPKTLSHILSPMAIKHLLKEKEKTTTKY